MISRECSDCQHSSAESESLDTSAGSETTPDGRRKITRARKPPEKFDNIIYSVGHDICRRIFFFDFMILNLRFCNFISIICFVAKYNA